MNPKSSLIIAALLLFVFFDLGVCRLEKEMIGLRKLSGVHDNTERGLNEVQNLELENLARFAVEEHNKKENSALKFSRFVTAREQVVAGKMYLLTFEASDGGKIKEHEAKVWVKPWINFKELQEFKPTDGSNV